jgi:hypothetical protein
VFAIALLMLCLLAISIAQHHGHSVGENDYDRAMALFITNGAGQGVVEAYEPVKLFGLVGGKSIFFDPAFVR